VGQKTGASDSRLGSNSFPFGTLCPKKSFIIPSRRQEGNSDVLAQCGNTNSFFTRIIYIVRMHVVLIFCITRGRNAPASGNKKGYGSLQARKTITPW